MLTAPLAGKSPRDVVAPKAVVNHMATFVRQCRRFLIVGSSGLDDDLLELLNEWATDVEMLHVVGGRPQEGNLAAWSESALEKYQQGVEAFSTAASVTPFPGGFVEYLNSNTIQELLG